MFFDLDLQHSGCGRIDFLQSDIQRLAIHHPSGLSVAICGEITFGLQINPLNVERQLFWVKWSLDLWPQLVHPPVKFRHVSMMAAPAINASSTVTIHYGAARPV